LKQELKVAEDAYGLYSHKLDEARTYEDMERERVESVRMIQQPTVPPDPSHIQLWIILGGAVAALFSTLMRAAWIEYFRKGFVTPEQLERDMTLPVLAVLSFRRQG